MSPLDKQEAVDEARRMIKVAAAAEERSLWEVVLRHREALLRGEIIVPITALQEPDIRVAIENDLKHLIEYSRPITKIEAVRYLRSRRLMCHGPLRSIEREWLDRMFAGAERVSLQCFFVPVELGEGKIEEMGGHLDPSGKRFICRSCPDSRRKK